MRSVVGTDITVAKLRSLPLFATLASSDLEAVAGMVRGRRYPKGGFIVSRGEPGRAMYLLVSGRVKLTIASPDGKELVLGYLDAPAHFGETSLADHQPHAADVVAITEAEVLALDALDLTNAIKSQPRLAVSIIGALSGRLRETIERLEDLTFYDATRRVQRVLFNVATARHEATGAPLIRGLTHYDIATLAGTSRETASRVISSLGKRGVVSVRGRSIFVNLDRMHAELSSEE